MTSKVIVGVGAIILACCLVGCTSPESLPGSPTADSSTRSTPGSVTEPYLVPSDRNGDGLITVGFTDVGPTDGWQEAHEKSYMEYFVEANGFAFVYSDTWFYYGESSRDVLNWVNEGVEVIVIYHTELVADWVPVLQVAKDARVPIIFDSHLPDVEEDLYLTYFTPDWEGQGKTAVAWLKDHIAAIGMTDPINILHIQGEINSPAHVGRTKALDEAAVANGWNIVHRLDGGWTRFGGQNAATAFLASGGQNMDFNVVFSESDDMTLGALEVFTTAGWDMKPLVIITFDGSKEIVQAIIDGEVDMVSEYTPYWGPQVGEVILNAAAGEKIPKITYTRDGIIDSTNAAEKLAIGW